MMGGREECCWQHQCKSGENCIECIDRCKQGKEEESKSGERKVDKIDDYGDLKQAAKSTDYILRHDKDSVNNKNEVAKEEEEEFDSFF